MLQPDLQLNDAEFKIISSKIEHSFGFQFDYSKKKEFTRILREVFSNSKSENWVNFIKDLSMNEFNTDTISVFTRFLTIGETYFFRENSVIEILFDKIIPRMVTQGKTKLIIWSVSCSTGEEPYTIAIMLKEKYPHLFHDAEIYGTDINDDFLHKAKKGNYRNWSFRNTPKLIKEKYFKKNGDEYFELSADIKNKVTFKHINLAHDFSSVFDFKNDFDIILFRNTMIYLSNKVNKNIVNQLAGFLTEGGCFIPGVAETFLVNSKLLKPLLYDHTSLFIKDSNYYQNKKSNETASILNLKFKNKYIRKPLKKTKTPTKHNIDITNKNLSHTKKGETNDLTLEEMQQIFKLGNYDTLIERFDSVKKKPQFKNQDNDLLNEMNLLYCKAFANKGAVNEAIKICEQFLQRNKLDSNLYKLTAQLYAESGNYNFALKHLNTAIFIESESPMLFFFRATVNSKLSNSAEAKKDLEQVAKLLKLHDSAEMLEEADGLTAGRLKDITLSLLTNMKN